MSFNVDIISLSDKSISDNEIGERSNVRNKIMEVDENTNSDDDELLLHEDISNSQRNAFGSIEQKSQNQFILENNKIMKINEMKDHTHDNDNNNLLPEDSSTFLHLRGTFGSFEESTNEDQRLDSKKGVSIGEKNQSNNDFSNESSHDSSNVDSNSDELEEEETDSNSNNTDQTDDIDDEKIRMLETQIQAGDWQGIMKDSEI